MSLDPTKKSARSSLTVKPVLSRDLIIAEAPPDTDAVIEHMRKLTPVQVREQFKQQCVQTAHLFSLLGYQLIMILLPVDSVEMSGLNEKAFAEVKRDGARYVGPNASPAATLQACADAFKGAEAEEEKAREAERGEAN